MDLQRYEWEQAASGEVRIAGVRPDGSTNLQAIAKRLGHVVKYVDLPNGEHGRVEFLPQSQQFCIYIDRRQSIVRQNFVLAHELAHLMLGHPIRNHLSSDPQNALTTKDPIEAEANHFAGSLLIPLSKLMGMLQAYPGFVSLYLDEAQESVFRREQLEQKIAIHFNTSTQTAKYRMLYLLDYGLIHD